MDFRIEGLAFRWLLKQEEGRKEEEGFDNL